MSSVNYENKLKMNIKSLREEFSRSWEEGRTTFKKKGKGVECVINKRKGKGVECVIIMKKGKVTIFDPFRTKHYLILEIISKKILL